MYMYASYMKETLRNFFAREANTEPALVIFLNLDESHRAAVLESLGFVVRHDSGCLSDDRDINQRVLVRVASFDEWLL